MDMRYSPFVLRAPPVQVVVQLDGRPPADAVSLPPGRRCARRL